MYPSSGKIHLGVNCTKGKMWRRAENGWVDMSRYNLLSSRALHFEEALYSASRRHDSLLQQRYMLGKVHGSIVS
jgi:hypothetical protein